MQKKSKVMCAAFLRAPHLLLSVTLYNIALCEAMGAIRIMLGGDGE
jgi:hypothetical protein